MFTFRSLALAALPLLASAFQITTPTQWLANTTVTVDWISVTTDPDFFSIYLFHPQFLPTGPIGIADSIDAFLFTYDIPLPRVTPGDGYYIQFVATGNINNVLAESGFFPIIQNDIDGSSSLGPSQTPTSNSRPEASSTTTGSESSGTGPVTRTPGVRPSSSTSLTSATSSTSSFTGSNTPAPFDTSAAFSSSVPRISAVVAGIAGLVALMW